MLCVLEDSWRQLDWFRELAREPLLLDTGSTPAMLPMCRRSCRRNSSNPALLVWERHSLVFHSCRSSSLAISSAIWSLRPNSLAPRWIPDSAKVWGAVGAGCPGFWFFASRQDTNVAKWHCQTSTEQFSPEILGALTWICSDLFVYFCLVSKIFHLQLRLQHDYL